MIVTVTPNPVLDRTLTVPHLAFGEVLRATSTRLDWGGKGFNVSRALAAWGVESVAMAFAGGATGQMLARGLHDLGIATDFIPVAGETRTNIVIVDEATGQHIKVNEPGPTVSDAECSLLFSLAQARARPGDTWVLAGSLPPGAPASLYADLIRLLHGRGARAILDASGEALRLGCTARPFLIKPNVEEAAEVTGRAVDSPAAARLAAADLLKMGIAMVALSLGSDGLLLAAGDRSVWAWPPKVSVSNPTGAGDNLLAGIVWALARDLPLAEVARQGVAAGTASAMAEGVGVGDRAAVEAIYDRVRVEEIH